MSGLWAFSLIHVYSLPHFHAEFAVVLVTRALRTLSSDRGIKSITESQEPRRV